MDSVHRVPYTLPVHFASIHVSFPKPCILPACYMYEGKVAKAFPYCQRWCIRFLTYHAFLLDNIIICCSSLTTSLSYLAYSFHCMHFPILLSSLFDFKYLLLISQLRSEAIPCQKTLLAYFGPFSITHLWPKFWLCLLFSCFERHENRGPLECWLNCIFKRSKTQSCTWTPTCDWGSQRAG